MPGSRLTSTTGPANPSSRKVAAAVPPALPPPTITNGFVPVPSTMRSFTPLGHDREDGGCEPLVGKSALPEGLNRVTGSPGLEVDAWRRSRRQGREVLDQVLARRQLDAGAPPLEPARYCAHRFLLPFPCAFSLAGLASQSQHASPARPSSRNTRLLVRAAGLYP